MSNQIRCDRKYELTIVPYKDCGHWIQKIIDRREKGRYTDDNDRTVMFDLLLESNGQKGFQCLSLEQLIDEAFDFRYRRN